MRFTAVCALVLLYLFHAEGQGVIAKPDPCICTKEYAPVCGVDGNTFGNRCEAACEEVDVACEGECPCRALCSCAPFEFPVCGIDGKTFGNPCLAGCAEVVVSCEGPCPCKKGCSCQPAPVCGSDDVTYLNDCRAEKAGVSVACNHACPCEPVLPCEVIRCASPCLEPDCPASRGAQCIAAGQCGCSAVYVSDCEIVNCDIPPFPSIIPSPGGVKPSFCRKKGKRCMVFHGKNRQKKDNCCRGLDCCTDCANANDKRLGGIGIGSKIFSLNRECMPSCPKCR